MKSFKFTLCDERVDNGINTVDVQGNNLVITTKDGKEFTTALPVADPEDYVVSGVLKGNKIVLTRKLSGTVDIDISSVMNALAEVKKKLPTSFTRVGNELKLALADGTEKKVTLPDDAKGVTDARLDGAELVLLGDDGEEVKRLDFSTLVPAAAADRFLKSVTVDGSNLVFTVGASGTTDGDQTLRVPAGDLSKVKTGQGVTGDGSTGNPLKVRVDETLSFTKDGKLTTKRDCVPVGNLNTLEVSESRNDDEFRRSGTNWLRVEGVSCFTWFIGSADGDDEGDLDVDARDTTGRPSDLTAAVETTAAPASSPNAELAAHSGWQVRSGNEITQFVSDDKGNSFSRTYKGGFKADGSPKSPDKWSKWQRLDNTQAAPPVSAGGFDCEAIGKLPEKLWSEGSTVLAKDKTGNCYRAKGFENLFHDVSVAVTSNKYTGLVTDNYRVTYTVSNSGVNKADNITLTVVKPLGDKYTLGNPTIEKQGNATVTQQGDVFKIKDLPKGGRVTVTYPVTFNEAGTLAFGGQVVSDGIDVAPTNNQASVILSASKANTATATESCPLINAVDVASGKQLRVTDRGLDNQDIGDANRPINVYATKDTLNGVQINVGEDRTVVAAYSDNASIRTSSNKVLIGGRASFAGGTSAYIAGISANNTVAVPYKNGIVTLPDAKVVVLGVRPNGNNCKWQIITLVATQAVSGCGAVADSGYELVRGNIHEEPQYNDNVNVVDSSADFVVTRNRGDTIGDTTALIRHQAGTAKTITVQANCDIIKTASTGNVKITPASDGRSATVEISARATSKDSAKYGIIEVRISD